MRGALRSGLTLVAGVVLLVVSCRANAESYRVRVGRHTFSLELADTPEERRRGLMYREDLGPDEGMLFVFPDSRMRSFWMRNTPLPLSIAYIDDSGVILEIHEMEPFSEAPVPSSHPVRYALEVNAGRFTEVGVRPGDRIQLSDLPLLEPK